jgi:hypothetical protein
MSRVYAGNFIYASDANSPAPVNNTGVNAQAVSSGTDTTTSASYVNLAGTGSQTSFPWEKKYDYTTGMIFLSAGWSAVTATTLGKFGVLINGVDYDITHMILGTGAVGMVSSFRLITGLVAGNYTVQGRWYREGGAGTASRSTNDWLSMVMQEIG